MFLFVLVRDKHQLGANPGYAVFLFDIRKQRDELGPINTRIFELHLMDEVHLCHKPKTIICALKDKLI